MATQNEARFAEAWRALDEDSTKYGWNTLRIATRSNLLLCAGRHHPRNQESMLIGFTAAALPKQTSLPQCKGFTLEVVELPFQGERYFCLAITRQPSASLDIFSAMLDDIVMVLERLGRTEPEHAAAVIDRISGWQRFMSREEDGILSAEELADCSGPARSGCSGIEPGFGRTEQYAGSDSLDPMGQLGCIHE
jgi:Putative  PD-(D/E)XK family member, (DUF4420)